MAASNEEVDGPVGYHTKLIEIAHQMASLTWSGDVETLRRFRVIYRHMAATVGVTLTNVVTSVWRNGYLETMFPGYSGR